MAKKKTKGVKGAARQPRKTEFPLRTLCVVGVYAVLIVATLSVYLQLRECDFVSYDDPFYVMDNKNIQEPISFHSLYWALTTGHFFNWHPLTYLSYMVDYQMFGLDAQCSGKYHMTNVVLHVLSALLLFEVVRRMTGALWRSAFVAALFALHPLHVESVAWVSERKDVLSGFFWLTTIWAYYFYVQRPGAGRYGAMAAAYALALMAKPMVVTLPFALLLLDYWPLGRFPVVGTDAARRRYLILALEKAPLLVLAAATSVFTLLAQRHGGSVMSLEMFPMGSRLANAAVSYLRYIYLTFCPVNLAVFYPHLGNSLRLWQSLGAGALLAAVTAGIAFLAWKEWRSSEPGSAPRHGYLATGWFWYLGTLVPVIGIVQVGLQGIADRYTYIPSMGLALLIVWGAGDLVEIIGARLSPARGRNLRAGVIVAGGVALAVMAFLAGVQTSYWKDSVTLYEHVIAVDPENSLAHNNLGEVLARDGRIDDAMVHFSETLRINSAYPGANGNLANILAMKGRTDEAFEHYRIAFEINPDDRDAHYNLGIELAKPEHSRTDEAIFHYREAIRIAPDFGFAHNNLAMELAKQGKFDEAYEHYQEALRIDPTSQVAQTNFKILLDQMKKAGHSPPPNENQALEKCHPDEAGKTSARATWPGAKVYPQARSPRSRSESRPPHAAPLESQ